MLLRDNGWYYWFIFKLLYALHGLWQHKKLGFLSNSWTHVKHLDGRIHHLPAALVFIYERWHILQSSMSTGVLSTQGDRVPKHRTALHLCTQTRCNGNIYWSWRRLIWNFQSNRSRCFLWPTCMVLSRLKANCCFLLKGNWAEGCQSKVYSFISDIELDA